MNKQEQAHRLTLELSPAFYRLLTIQATFNNRSIQDELLESYKSWFEMNYIRGDAYAEDIGPLFKGIQATKASS